METVYPIENPYPASGTLERLLSISAATCSKESRAYHRVYSGGGLTVITERITPLMKLQRAGVYVYKPDTNRSFDGSLIFYENGLKSAIVISNRHGDDKNIENGDLKIERVPLDGKGRPTELDASLYRFMGGLSYGYMLFVSGRRPKLYYFSGGADSKIAVFGLKKAGNLSSKYDILTTEGLFGSHDNIYSALCVRSVERFDAGELVVSNGVGLLILRPDDRFSMLNKLGRRVDEAIMYDLGMRLGRSFRGYEFQYLPEARDLRFEDNELKVTVTCELCGSEDCSCSLQGYNGITYPYNFYKIESQKIARANLERVEKEDAQNRIVEW